MLAAIIAAGAVPVVREPASPISSASSAGGRSSSLDSFCETVLEKWKSAADYSGSCRGADDSDSSDDGGSSIGTHSGGSAAAAMAAVVAAAAGDGASEGLCGSASSGDDDGASERSSPAALPWYRSSELAALLVQHAAAVRWRAAVASAHPASAQALAWLKAWHGSSRRHLRGAAWLPALLRLSPPQPAPAATGAAAAATAAMEVEAALAPSPAVAAAPPAAQPPPVDPAHEAALRRLEEASQDSSD